MEVYLRSKTKSNQPHTHLDRILSLPDESKPLFLFNVQTDEIVCCNTDHFECFACGKKAKGVKVIGRATNQYKVIKGLRRRRVVDIVKENMPCGCHGQIYQDEIWMSNTEAEVYLMLENYHPGKPYTEMESDLSKPFFIKVGLSAKGEKANLKKRRDGIYTESGIKLCDRVLPVR